MTTERPLRVLLAEDSEDDAFLVGRELRRGGFCEVMERVETRPAMKEALALRGFDIIISDYSMPTFDALGALSVLKESGLDLPFIVVSGTVGEASAVTALRGGAHDFMVKGKLARLVPAIERELRDAEARASNARWRRS